MTEMWKKNRWISLLMAAMLLFTSTMSFAETQTVDLPLQQERADDAAEDAGAVASPSIFENEEINRLIDENYLEIEKKGYVELRIPMELHQITMDYISPDCLQTARRLLDAGYTAYVVGGAVRDLINGTETSDFDLTTNATVAQMQEIFGEDLFLHSTQTGYTFAGIHYPSGPVDLATHLNIPAAYAGLENMPDFDPTQLYSDNLMFDAIERDMSINALFYDVSTGDLVDFHGGLHDLREKVLNSMAPPEVQYMVDPASAIRALRFKARYGYSFSPAVEQAMRAHAVEFMERADANTVSSQLPRFFPAGYARQSYEVLLDYGVFRSLLPVTGDLADTEAYQDWCRNAMDFMDRWYLENGSHANEFAFAVFLWPVIQARLAPEDSGSFYALLRAMVDVMEEFHQRCNFFAYRMDFLSQVLVLQSVLTDPESLKKPEGLIGQDAFETAFVLLQIRSQSGEDSLTDTVTAWAEAIYKTLSEEEQK